MNPSYTAYNKALLSTIMNTFMGIEPPAPKAKKDPNVGPAFAKNTGIQQDVPSEEKENKVRAHLDKLATEAKARSIYPCSDMVTEGNEHQAQRELAAQLHASDLLDKTNTAFKTAQAGRTPHWMPGAFRDIDLANARALDDAQQAEKEAYNTAADAKVMAALYGSDNGTKIEHDTPYDLVVKALHETHRQYIDRQLAANRSLRPMVKDEPKYPRSDMVVAMEEEQERREAAANACIYSGERANLNYDNYTDEAL